MKLALACTVFVFLLAGCSHRERDAKAIDDVMVAQGNAVLSATAITNYSGVTVTNHSIAVYLSALHGISATNCPHDFRLAWIEYVRAWDDKEEYSHFTAATSRVDTLTPWRHVQTVGARYANVDFQAIERRTTLTCGMVAFALGIITAVLARRLPRQGSLSAALICIAVVFLASFILVASFTQSRASGLAMVYGFILTTPAAIACSVRTRRAPDKPFALILFIVAFALAPLWIGLLAAFVDGFFR